jgi:CelD/BcsL family acetyltransferase involved in cellulose biosynthesis
MLAPRDVALTTEWRPLAHLAGLAAEWRTLAHRCAEPNVFYEPEFALAAAALAPDAGAVLVRATDTRQLVGMFPCRIEAKRYGIRLPMLVGWTHPYAPLGVPLIDRDMLGPAVAAFLDHAADDPDLPKLLLLPYQVEDGPVARALIDAIARRGGDVARFGRHHRALLAPGRDRAGYLDAALDRKKRKELARQRRRLDETGRVSFAMVTDPAEVGGAMAEFLALEARSWKGAAGSAAAQNDAIRSFMEQAVAGLAAEGSARIARLAHDGRVIAAGVLLTSRDGAWFWKIAHDESAARASPGVQLTLDLTAAILAEGAIAWCDSCATADHPMIDSIWRERRAMVDLLLAPEPSAAFNRARRLERLRRGAVAAARRIRDLFDRR